MIKKIVTLLLATALFAPFANALEINCLRDDGADDWRISGVLGGGSIYLFDNDSDSEFKLTHLLESLPPIYVYAEVADPSTKIYVKASRDKKSAVATFRIDNADYDIQFTCDVE